MNKEEYNAIKATFPWSSRVIQTRTGSVMQLLNNRGEEVSLITMMAFLEMITAKIIAPREEAEDGK